ncbi:MAG: aspartate-semialdehyde dehydrogenase [Phycisphaerales bacterium]|nr:aspartate-semialdehyde dehydrogenase [Phycisphaerales bacterium]
MSTATKAQDPQAASCPSIDSLMPGSPGERLGAARAAWLRERLEGRRIAVVGASGAVGLETLALLAEAGVDPERVIAAGSARSAGRTLAICRQRFVVHEASDRLDADAAVLATPAAVSKRLAPALAERGVLVSDNSSALRHSAPLVIPEVNPEAACPNDRIIASPNCTTTIALTACEGVRRNFGVRSIQITSQQAISGAGLIAMQTLIRQTEATLGVYGDEQPAGFGIPLAFNAFPHESDLNEPGLCGEELKFRTETARIWNDTCVSTDACCLRVPTLRSHLVVVRLQTELPCTKQEAEQAIAASPGVVFVESGPDAISASKRCDVLAGRVVAEPSLGVEGSEVRLVAAGDQLLKGAAWNALQNLALLIERRG